MQTNNGKDKSLNWQKGGEKQEHKELEKKKKESSLGLKDLESSVT